MEPTSSLSRAPSLRALESPASQPCAAAVSLSRTRGGRRGWTAGTRDERSPRICRRIGTAGRGPVEDVGRMVASKGRRGGKGRTGRMGSRRVGRRTQRRRRVSRLPRSPDARVVHRRHHRLSNHAINRQITQSPDHPIPCTSSFTPRPHSVFSRPLRSPKRSSIAPHHSGIRRSRCLIATASTARPGFIKRPGRLGFSRLSGRS